MRRTTLTVLALLASFALVATGCGDDSSTADESPTTSSTTTSSTTTTTTEAPPSTTEPPTTTTEPAVPALIVGGEADEANAEELQAFLASHPADEPFYMVNLIRYRDVAQYADGRSSDLTGEEADTIYTEFMRETKLPEIGAEVVYVGEVERDLSGGSQFDRVAVVRYPSPAEFQTMVTSADFQEMSVHKHAGVADTVVLATTLVSTPGAPERDDYPFPATDDDQPFAFVHVLDYRDTAVYQPGDEDADDSRPGRDAVALYSGNAGAVAVPLGVQPQAWFDVQAIVIGPVDTWEEVRINWFPSHATFDALTSDPQWQSGSHHRRAGLEQTYAIMTAPTVNDFG